MGHQILSLSGTPDFNHFYLTHSLYIYNLFVSDCIIIFPKTGNCLHDYHLNAPFSTSDRDNDMATTFDCAGNFKGGWWYATCFQCKLTGSYGLTQNTHKGIRWNPFRPSATMAYADLKIRRNWWIFHELFWNHRGPTKWIDSQTFRSTQSCLLFQFYMYLLIYNWFHNGPIVVI